MDEDVIVSADWLAARLGDVRVVDVRDAWEYDGIGHIPGAVNVPFDEFRRDASGGDAANQNGEGPRHEGEAGREARDTGMLPGAAHWASLLGARGITADDTLVAYDDMHGVFAARFLVTAMVYGHEDLHLLDGDYSAWVQAHETTTDPPAIETTTYAVRDVETPLVDADTVAAAIDDPEAVVVDTRSPDEFADGHIPGAVNLDWRTLVDDDTRGLLPRDAVEARLADRGVTRDRRVVLYCNTARRISHTYVVLAWLGFPDVEFYEGSLSEWRAAGRPVTTGD
jgi:thiosulfate/3-mercaptopyruvate sulfurtransferase